MNYRGHLLVDMDGVIADWNALFAERIREMYPHIDFPFLKENHSWDMSHGLDAEGKAAIKSIMALSGFYADLKPIPGAAEALNEMLDENYKVSICTSPFTENMTCASDKLMWLNRDIGKGWADRAIITYDKTAVRGDVLFDDRPDITGLYVPEWEHILFDAPYNKSINDGRRRMTDWSQWREFVACRDDSLELAANFSMARMQSQTF